MSINNDSNSSDVPHSKGVVPFYVGKVIRARLVLSLLCIAFSLQSHAAHKHKKKAKGVEDTMTVAAARTPNTGETFTRITFTKSQRFYKLPNDADPGYMELLKASEKNHTPVVIRRAKEESDIILSVRKP